MYNMKQYIERSVRSVLRQSYGEFEIIVVDDGSTDGSAAVVEAIHDPRIRLVRQDNAGVSAARNKGISLARYDRICFLDADDQWDSGFLDAVAKLSHEYPSAGIYGTGYRMVFPEGPSVEVTADEAIHQDTSLLVTDYFFRVNGGNLINASGVMVPRAVFEKVGCFLVKEHHGEDIEMWARIALRYPIAYDTRILFSYYQTGKANKPRYNDVVEYDPRTKLLESALIESSDLLVNREELISHLRKYIAKRCVSVALANTHPETLKYLRNSNARTWIPLLNKLARTREGWLFLRFLGWVYKAARSRIAMRMLGGRRASSGVLRRLMKNQG